MGEALDASESLSLHSCEISKRLKKVGGKGWDPRLSPDHCRGSPCLDSSASGCSLLTVMCVLPLTSRLISRLV